MLERCDAMQLHAMMCRLLHASHVKSRYNSSKVSHINVVLCCLKSHPEPYVALACAVNPGHVEGTRRRRLATEWGKLGGHKIDQMHALTRSEGAQYLDGTQVRSWGELGIGAARGWDCALLEPSAVSTLTARTSADGLNQGLGCHEEVDVPVGGGVDVGRGVTHGHPVDLKGTQYTQTFHE